MGPEKKVEEQIKNDLLARGAYMFKHHASSHNKKGIPDIHAVYAGFAVFIEVKAPNTGVVSVQQKNILKPFQIMAVLVLFHPIQHLYHRY